MNKSMWLNGVCTAFAFFMPVAPSPAQTLTTLVNFQGTDGNAPEYMTLVQGVGGELYGTTFYITIRGGEGPCDGGCGTIFKMTPAGALTTLYEFDGTDGAYPAAGLIQATDGSFYGTTSDSAGTSVGTVFKITAGGALTTMYSFCSQGVPCTDGQQPYAGLVQATNGDLYGTTSSGGAGSACPPSSGDPGCGTVFKITPSGALTTLYNFCSQSGCADGLYPWGAMVQGFDGNFYGTSTEGGVYGWGSLFKITPEGQLTTLHSFNLTDGADPYGSLVQANDGNFYGTTHGGGVGSDASGTIFKITPEGELTTLHTFIGSDGATPLASLVQATDGNFYGTTSEGGASGAGTIFEIAPGGTLTTLHSFCTRGGCPDGSHPSGGLLQATDGSLYGATTSGGADAYGTVFNLSVGLGPFVKTLPTSAKVGAAITILGTNLTGATSVSFNGAAAVFTVNARGTAISTTVPSGATTGKIEVTTPGGILVSNAGFRVAP